MCPSLTKNPSIAQVTGMVSSSTLLYAAAMFPKRLQMNYEMSLSSAITGSVVHSRLCGDLFLLCY